MPDTFRIPTKFLKVEGFPVIGSFEELSRTFDNQLNDQAKWLYIESVDGVSIDEQFSPSEVLYRLARREYDRAFEQWSMQYVHMSDGSYLHKDYEQSAWDCWVAHCEDNKTNVEEG